MGFISYVSSPFGNIQFVTGVTNEVLGQSIQAARKYANYSKRDGQLKFISPRGYDNVWVYAAKRTMMQLTFAKINDLYPQYIRHIEKKKREAAYEKYQGSNMNVVIGGNKNNDENFLKKQNVTVNYMGKPVPEALVLWVQNESETKQRININTYWDKIRGLSGTNNEEDDSKLETYIEVPADKDHLFFDLSAKVQAKSSNNVVLTKVQGRDYSRKELISNGDITFAVSGTITSNYPDVYPYEAVSRFITLMQHKGVLNVSNLMFGQFNVNQIIIKDFELSQRTGFKNVQPYQFTCVCVEPDEAVKFVKDTIKYSNLKINYEKPSGWSKVLKEIGSATVDQSLQLLEKLIAQKI